MQALHVGKIYYYHLFSLSMEDDLNYIQDEDEWKTTFKMKEKKTNAVKFNNQCTGVMYQMC